MPFVPTGRELSRFHCPTNPRARLDCHEQHFRTAALAAGDVDILHGGIKVAPDFVGHQDATKAR